MQRQHGDYVPRKLVQESHVKKYWSELRAPMLRELYFGSELVIPDSQIELQDTAIIGEAQSGKSSVLRFACLSAYEAYRASQASCFPVWIDLGLDLGADLDVVRHLKQVAEDIGAQSAQLFIDSIDEAMLVKGHRFLNDLKSGLRQYFSDSPLCIASRRWALGLGELESIRSGMRVLTTDILSRDFYHGFFANNEEKEKFSAAVEERGYHYRLDRAVDGIRMIKSFQRDGSLPSRSAMFDERLSTCFRSACKDPDITVSDSKLRRMSEVLACCSILCGQISWTKQEAQDFLAAFQSSSLGECRPQEVQILLGSSLFRTGGGKYTFRRDEERERLAAMALSGLPLRKLRMVMRRGTEGIHPVRRGLAQHIANRCERFFRYLTEIDPVAAVFVERESEGNDELLRSFFAFVVDRDLVPWQRLPPADEELQRVLYFRRPADPDKFLSEWIEQADDIPRLWGALGAKLWETTVKSNPILLRIALDEAANPPARKAAIQAIAATGDHRALLSLGFLHKSNESEPRGYWIEAVLKARQLSVLRVLTLFRGGRRERLVGKLLMVAKGAAQFIDPRELDLGFRLLVERKKEFDDLWEALLEGLLERAADEDVSLSHEHLGAILGRHDHYHDCVRVATNYIGRSSSGIEKFLIFLSKEREKGPVRRWSPWSCIRNLANLSTSVLLPALRSLKDRISSDPLLQNLSEEHNRLQNSESTNSLLNSELELELPEPRDGAIDENALLNWRVLNILTQDQNNEEVVFELYSALHRDTPLSGRLLPNIFEEAQSALREFWNGRQLQALEDLPGGGWREARLARVRQQDLFLFALDLAVPFGREEVFSYFSIYGFGGPTVSIETIYSAAARFRYEAPDLYEEALEAALRGPRPSGTVDYLASIASHRFEDEARKLLRAPELMGDNLLFAVERYWDTIQTDDYEGVLFDYYQAIRKCVSENLNCRPNLNQGRADRLLFNLCGEGYTPAWEELQRRASSGDFPSVDSSKNTIPSLPSPEYAEIYIQWYPRAVRLKSSFNNLPALLLSAAKDQERQAAISTLTQMRENTDVPWAKTLASRYLFETLYGDGDLPPEVFPLKELALFLGSANSYAASSNFALWETILEALEREAEQYQAAEGVEGFWNHKKYGVRTTPKTERACQNSLWHNLRTRLESLGIFGAKERIIADGYADFWCELPSVDGSVLKVPIELKVAGKNRGREWLVAPIETQLFQKYMAPAGCRYGVFLVKMDGPANPQ
ncbi:MAG TPA: hypothetical protein EYO33_22330 [Phycisphaerales bacterium]|nr:hypothetical protein [Phycisphaerales bacterium]